MDFTHSFNFSMGVSSSQGFTSRRTDVLAMRAGFFAFLAAYA